MKYVISRKKRIHDNVYNWLNHDYANYSLMRKAISLYGKTRKAARYIQANLGSLKTPDGFTYSLASIYAAVLCEE